jgi:hypothetical protein
MACARAVIVPWAASRERGRQYRQSIASAAGGTGNAGAAAGEVAIGQNRGGAAEIRQCQAARDFRCSVYGYFLNLQHFACGETNQGVALNQQG